MDIKAIDNKTTEMCSQLLTSLKEDLRCLRFMDDFIDSGGVECLLEILRRQNNWKASKCLQHVRIISNNQYNCLLCLKYAVQNPKGMFHVAKDVSSICFCFISSFLKTRILALQILLHVLESTSDGHTIILEALSAMRMLFGEAVRFKFLVGLVQGPSPPLFQSTALKFLNTLLKNSPRPADRIRLQCELEEAGLNVNALETELQNQCVPCTDPIWLELEIWKESFLDMQTVTCDKQNLVVENERLQKEVQLLRKALQKLEEDKINLMKIEMELKEKCQDLNDEVATLKREKSETMEDGDHFTINSSENPFQSADRGREEIFIDVLRPPIGFRSGVNSPILSEESDIYRPPDRSLSEICGKEESSKTNASRIKCSVGVLPSYQFPAAYKNNFLKKGHSTCGLYSGDNNRILETLPADYCVTSSSSMSSLVHREITKAVKQISGWI